MPVAFPSPSSYVIIAFLVDGSLKFKSCGSVMIQ